MLVNCLSHEIDLAHHFLKGTTGHVSKPVVDVQENLASKNEEEWDVTGFVHFRDSAHELVLDWVADHHSVNRDKLGKYFTENDLILDKLLISIHLTAIPPWIVGAEYAVLVERGCLGSRTSASP